MNDLLKLLLAALVIDLLDEKDNYFELKGVNNFWINSKINKPVELKFNNDKFIINDISITPYLTSVDILVEMARSEYLDILRYNMPV